MQGVSGPYYYGPAMLVHYHCSAASGLLLDAVSGNALSNAAFFEVSLTACAWAGFKFPMRL